ncbi:hypothetical protein Tco_0394177 [Tanacetum coccineum]
MAALKCRDEHNKVGYLQKPKGSDDYHQILDFLRASHIRNALTHDPIIFDSLVKQFWSTTTLRSPELGPLAILATIDKTPYTITEESVRSQLQLADAGVLMIDLCVGNLFGMGIILGLSKSMVVGSIWVAQLLLLLFVFLMGEDLTGSRRWERWAVVQDVHTTIPKTYSRGLGIESNQSLDHLPPFELHETEEDSLGGFSHVSPQVTQDSNTGHASEVQRSILPVSALSSESYALVKKKVKALEVKTQGLRKGGGVECSRPRKKEESQLWIWSGTTMFSFITCQQMPEEKLGGWLQDFDDEERQERAARGSCFATNYSMRLGNNFARFQAKPDLSSTIFGVDFTDNDFAAKMVDLVTSQRKELAEQRAKERRDRPMTPAQLRQYMRTYVKNQGPVVYSTGWTMAQVRKLSPEQLQEEFDKI